MFVDEFVEVEIARLTFVKGVIQGRIGAVPEALDEVLSFIEIA